MTAHPTLGGLSWAEVAGLALIAGAWAAVWELRRRPLVEG